MKEITNVSVEILKVHPRNTEFFDDIKGEEYERFKKSIAEDGLLSPILVSPDMTIISGHQRVKACRDLGIKLVPVMIREDLVGEDEKLKTLLVANFGRSKNDPIKQGKVYGEYEKLCGVQRGNNQHSLPHYAVSITQDQIAKELGISVDTIQRLKSLQTLSPELQELISDGKITPTTGYKLLTRLTDEEQTQLIESLDVTKKMTQTQIQEYIDKMKRLENVNAGLQLKVNNKETEITNAVTNATDKLNRQIVNLHSEKSLLERKVKLNQEDSDKYNKLKKDIDFLTQQKTDLSRQITSATELAGLTVRLQNILEKELAPIKYKRCMEVLNQNDVAMQNFIDVVNIVEKWLNDMKQYLPNGNVINVNCKEI